jgi:catechol 2,3-dioxygenase
MQQTETQRLPPTAAIGDVELSVHDLNASLEFYEHALGFRRFHEAGAVAELGSDRSFLRLVEEPSAKPRPRGVAGLYHVAYLVPSRADLAWSLVRLAGRGARLQGASDHAVSEALYLADPDGHGIEIYADRPREAWPRVGERLQMTTLPLDLHGLLQTIDASPSEALGEARGRLPTPVDDKVAAGTRIGHIHLNVGDVAAADRFYREAVGFERIVAWPGASFLSAGGYHHHVAVNAWEGVGAPPAPQGTLGLRRFSVSVPDPKAARAARERLGLDGAGTVQDPSGNPLTVVG